MANKNLNAAKTTMKAEFYTQPEEPGTAAPIQDAEVIPESSQEEQHPIDGGKVKEEVMWEGNHQQPINWWMVVAIVAIIALIAGVIYYLWDFGYI